MTTPALPPSLVDKVANVVVNCRDVEDLAPGLERVLGLELNAAEVAYLEDLDRAVIRAVLEARPPVSPNLRAIQRTEVEAPQTGLESRRPPVGRATSRRE